MTFFTSTCNLINIGNRNLPSKSNNLSQKRNLSFEVPSKTLWEELTQEELREKQVLAQENLKKRQLNKNENNPQIIKPVELYRRKSCCSYLWSGGMSKKEAHFMDIPFEVNRPEFSAKRVQKSLRIETQTISLDLKNPLRIGHLARFSSKYQRQKSVSRNLILNGQRKSAFEFDTFSPSSAGRLSILSKRSRDSGEPDSALLRSDGREISTPGLRSSLPPTQRQNMQRETEENKAGEPNPIDSEEEPPLLINIRQNSTIAGDLNSLVASFRHEPSIFRSQTTNLMNDIRALHAEKKSLDKVDELDFDKGTLNDGNNDVKQNHLESIKASLTLKPLTIQSTPLNHEGEELSATKAAIGLKEGELLTPIKSKNHPLEGKVNSIFRVNSPKSKSIALDSIYSKQITSVKKLLDFYGSFPENNEILVMKNNPISKKKSPKMSFRPRTLSPTSIQQLYSPTSSIKTTEAGLSSTHTSKSSQKMLNFGKPSQHPKLLADLSPKTEFNSDSLFTPKKSKPFTVRHNRMSSLPTISGTMAATESHRNESPAIRSGVKNFERRPRTVSQSKINKDAQKLLSTINVTNVNKLLEEKNQALLRRSKKNSIKAINYALTAYGGSVSNMMTGANRITAQKHRGV